MKPFAIAFSGGIKSGKSSLASKVAANLGWPRVSFPDRVRALASEQGRDPNDRKVLQEIGEMLVRTDPKQFCEEVLAQAAPHWKKGQGIVLDGLRHAEIADALRPLVAPAELRIVFVNTDTRIRANRLADQVTSDTLDQLEMHSTEVQVKDVLFRISDFVVDGSINVDNAAKQVLDWIMMIGPNKS